MSIGRVAIAACAAMLAACGPASQAGAQAPQTDIAAFAEAAWDAKLRALYEHLHANPELSFVEVETAKRLAAEMRDLGFEVTEGVGGTGLVAVLENGDGPTVMVRTDLDALPVKEQTGLPYASTAVGVTLDGLESPVMHACGHDVHMTAWIGTASYLIQNQDRWSGTLVMIGQPAEELGQGARAMLADGLFERFPRPDFNLALHDAADLPSGVVGVTPGFALANVDSVDILVKGRGGHGAYPHTTVDPIVIGARIVGAVQTLVSREISPLDSAVVTVGAFHAGSKHNIIPDEARLQLTVRSYSDETRQRLLDGIERIARAQALSAGLPDELAPEVIVRDEYTPANYNDPELAERAAAAIRAQMGDERVVRRDPVMGGEDFGQYGRVEPKIPSLIFWVGAVEPGRYAAAKEAGETLPSLHSPFFAPDAEATITTGVEAMTAIVLDLMAPGQ